MALTIGAIVLLLINAVLWLLAPDDSQGGGKTKDISGCIPQVIRTLGFVAWCWWFCARAGRAFSLQLYELVLLDTIFILVFGIGAILAVIEAAKDGLNRHWWW